MNNAWTGGQYSVWRVLFGSYLFVHFVQLIPWGTEVFSNQGVLPREASPLVRLFPNVLAVVDAPWMVTTLLVLAGGSSVLLAIGLGDRFAAVFLWYVWACLFGRNPLISNPGLPYVGLLLVVHALMPRAPYGSFECRGRADPGSRWRMPGELFAVVWILMAVGYSYSGVTKRVSASWLDGSAMAYLLQSPLARPGWLRDVFVSLPSFVHVGLSYGALAMELLFAPLALWARARPWLWLAMLLMHFGLIALIDFADLSLGMVMLHLFTFNPAWVKAKVPETTELVFYDGNCGLCHRAIRFLLSEDFRGTAFRFAPLDSDAFRHCVPERERAGLPDSVVVRTPEGVLLSRAAAVRRILVRLGGLWRILGEGMRIIPVSWQDRAYDGIASVRKRLFAAPKSACPILPPPLRSRFEL